MFKHVNEDHTKTSEKITFDWKVTGRFRKPIERQLNEAVNIQSTKEENRLNSKNEYFSHDLERFALSNIKYYQCKKCGLKTNNQEDLEKHEDYVHVETKCVLCDYETFGTRDLKSHKRREHK